ncbi:hypothetical protein [Prosthecobacter sp.]|uniref:hypothetical protein n=1 Tax=Prosthecobacter sp. TaxID=1965333 RepID=UPI003783E1A1
MDAYFSESGFEVMFKGTEEAASVPLPFCPHMHSLFVRREHSSAAPTGFTDSVLRWNIARVGGPAFKLLVRYYDGHAVRVVICSYVKYTKERRDLRDALAKMFPHVQITFEDLCPPDWARVVQ